MRILFLLAFLAFSSFVFAQHTSEANDSLPIHTFDSLCFRHIGLQDYPTLDDVVYSTVTVLPLPSPYTIANANQLIQTDGPLTIVIRGGFQGFPEENEKRSYLFREKYPVVFDYAGCIQFYDPSTEDIEGYNAVILEHLEKRYGKKCLKEFNAVFK